ncbi:Receptor-type guanylate cyclase gcy [Seminavis robusta]|uniref:Receptor-type guanylate cyclase gcy n=1 Tax=Seminavis robusta TaxID=568900 RepID=A0A9N8DKJ4_9STRA|nr:Receptor-type guanylate cyclase gcy [Seminavis robusta]|eukprot:Sro205_g086270.1 Receptor-type guanylate cyclase gcy (1149) ;mRNA; f:51565-56412
MKAFDKFEDETLAKSTDEEELDSETSLSSVTRRDEVLEVRKQSSKETARVRTWKCLAFLALLGTAVSVTATTYALLVKQEHDNFRTVYYQFARTVADSAVNQQRDVLDGLCFLSNSISLSALQHQDSQGNLPWPFFLPPMFETTAEKYMAVSKAEHLGFNSIVSHENKDAFLDFAAVEVPNQIRESHLIKYGNTDKLNNETKLASTIIQKTKDGWVPDVDGREWYHVRSAQAPPSRKLSAPFMWNINSNPGVNSSMTPLVELRNETFYQPVKKFMGLTPEEHKGYHADNAVDNPHFFVYHPINKYPDDPHSEVVATLATTLSFDAAFRKLLPDNVKGMYCVIENSCGQTITYLIDGEEAYYKNMSDLHDPRFDDMAVYQYLMLSDSPALQDHPAHCRYHMNIYPTKEFESDYKSNTPVIYAVVVATTFAIVALIFLVFDRMVGVRNEIMVSNAAKSNAIVSSVVPDHLRDRWMQSQEQDNSASTSTFTSTSFSTKANLSSFLNNSDVAVEVSSPLADLYLDTTVLFADIANFDAWSSTRAPTDVFILLETLFQAFDAIARRRRVYKVESVRDCYVAVCGLPESNPTHSITMARFGRDILSKTHLLTKALEVKLGPDTGDLDLRVGIHSGPVTAGVLRGDRCRFQLFGSTMNSCQDNLFQSGKPNKIQCSRETTEHLTKLGKGGWVCQRTDLPDTQGLGTGELYWVTVPTERAGSTCSAASSDFRLSSTLHSGHDGRTKRLIDWNVEMLSNLMKEIVARRGGVSVKSTKGAATESRKTLPLEEVREIIELPAFDSQEASKQMSPEDVTLPLIVTKQLRQLVSTIACMYNDNPFHNFDHASHVVMSVIKLMGRIVGPSDIVGAVDEDNHAESLHDHTYGITSDPLTQFACAFSALIHDVDHVGVSNAQLVKEGVPIASKYGERSVAEQNSLDLSWDLLMGPEFEELRAFLFPSAAELTRFRQLVVNSVMATDIVDKDLKALRNGRWEKAFTSQVAKSPTESPRDATNRKATIVIEHIIQASDISHTMQHWHVYRKWNQNLFEELYVAYLNGRMEKDPAEFWFKGEIGFFDFYIIPLTEKLKECGVFGVSSGEYLDYALKNKREWVANGEKAVAEMVDLARSKYGVKGEETQPPMPALLEEGVPFGEEVEV